MATQRSDQHAASPGVEEELLIAARALAEAIVANDVARIGTCVTEDWVIVSETGVSEGKTLLALIASGQLTHSAMEMVGEPQIRVLGPTTAVLTARITNTAHFEGQRTDADEWTTDVYVHRGGQWRCAYTHYTSARLV
jgi:ketosteroid isomerase-like protein